MSASPTRTAPRLGLFLSDSRGNVAIIFALLLTPLVTVIGMALDFSRAGTIQSRLQNAVDTAALAVAVDAPSLGEDALAQRASDVLNANFRDMQGTTITSVDVVRGDDEITVTAQAVLPSSFAALVGINDIPVSASANTVWGGNPVELALVLDNTGSMNREGKLDTLQDAVNDMLDMLEATTRDEGALHVAIVPFTTQVRLETSFSDATWLLGVPQDSGSGSGGGSGWLWDWWRSRYGSGGGSSSGGTTWDGCVTDREQPYDTNDTAPSTSNQATLYPVATCENSSLEEILPLTDDFRTLRRKIDDLRADGNTNVTIGVAWGMAALSNRAPLTEASAPGEVEGLKRIMVVLTDGENTENRWSTRTRDIDPRTALACQAAKDQGIIVYAVRVIDGNRNLLRDCATDPSHYFDVENVGELLPVFQAIGTRISELRIAR